MVHRDNTKCVRLPDATSIFRAELYALLLAIDVVRRSKEKNFVIFTDSMSSLQSIFCKLRKPHPEPTLLLNGTPVPVVEETKFLGVVFDRKLSFIPHIKHLKDKCTKALNLLRVLAHTSWGADQETLLHLYRSLIRSKLDYGCLWICSWHLPADA